MTATCSIWIMFMTAPGFVQDYAPVDPDLKIVVIDSDAKETFGAVRADTMGRLFVAGRDAIFVLEPKPQGGYQPRKLLYRFPPGSQITDVEFRGNDLYVLT